MTRRLAREDMSLIERAHAQRLGLGPYYVGVLTLVLGHLSWPLRDHVETWVALGTVGLLVLVWMATRLHGWTHLGYGLIVFGACCGWIWWLHETVTFDEWLGRMFWWVIGLHLIGLGWWSSRFKRTQVHLEDDLRGWEEIAANFGLGMTKRHITSKDKNGNEAGFLVFPRGSTTVKKVLERREELEQAMGLPEGTLRLMKHTGGGKRAATDRVDYVSFIDDPLDEAQDWPGPQQGPDGEDLSVDVPCAVGPQEDNKVAYLPYYERDINAVVNKLFGGSQGSGKSGGFTLHIMDVACRSDGTQWGIDMKDGMEIAPFDAIMDNLATNAEESVEMVDALDSIMTYRGEENTRRGRKAWPVSPEQPLLFVWIDELHRLLASANGRDPRQMRKCEEVMVRLATTGRALGMSVNGATQNPTLEATRTSQFRDRLNQRVCFRTESASHEGYIIPNRKVDAHLIPSSMPGMAYIQDRDRFTGMPVRYYRVTDEMVDAVLAIRAPGLPLDEGSRRAAMAASPRYAARCAARYGDSLDDDGGAPVPTPDDDGPVDQDGGATVIDDITPDPVPVLDLSGPDVKVSDILRHHRRIHDPAAAEQGAVAVADRPAEEPAAPEQRSARERLADIPTGEAAVFGVLEQRRSIGASPADLVAASGMSRAWTQRELARWKDEGRVVQPGGKGTNYYLPAHAPREANGS